MIKSKGQITYQIVVNVVLILMTVCVIVPFILLFMSSITEEKTLLSFGYSFFPRVFSTESYQYIFRSSDKIFRAYGITIFVTFIGTIVNVLISALLAYPLSLKNLPGRKFFNFYVFFTMLFNGGLVPTYLMYTGVFHVKDTIFGLIIPNFLLSAMNVLLIRSYISSSIPEALFEAAQIDGAGQFRIFSTIVLPMGKPILVTMGTFAGLTYWNDWTNGLYYIGQNTGLYNIQNLLNKMITDLQFLTSSNMAGRAGEEAAKIPSTGVQMAIAFIALIPILVIFPFLQKYFQKGIALGAVKG